MLEITEEIKNFLDSTEGRKFFREITPHLTPAARTEFKKSLLNPPRMITRRRVVMSLLSGKINELNIKKKLDNTNPI